MGTRATYNINQVQFYIHWDGYPEGAASYFQNMLDNDKTSDQPNNTYQDSFIRGNKLAYHTNDCDLHSDREYHYQLEGSDLWVYELAWNETPDKSNLFYSGTVQEFIKKWSK